MSVCLSLSVCLSVYLSLPGWLSFYLFLSLSVGLSVLLAPSLSLSLSPLSVSVCVFVPAGVLFDVDGVLVRGGSLIPAARRAFRKLLDSNNNFLFPVVFVTNAGSCQRHQKADQLSRLLDVQITPDQVVLSYSPLRMLRSFHEKCVLVSGQGPVTDIANSLGFQKVVTIEQLRQHHPLLDMVDHNRRPSLSSSPLHSLPKIEAIILFGEPVRWETNLQLLVDVLLTNGSPGSAYQPQPSVQLPVLACNMDLMWMAEAPSPRFGHGMFLLCLESIYRKLMGRDLQYQGLLGKPGLLTYQYAEQLLRKQNNNHKLKTIYAVGDNLMTDIYGANLYNRYLAQQHVTMVTSSQVIAQGSGTEAAVAVPEEELACVAAECHSILVCTGVYNPHASLPSNESSSITETVFHGHRDLVLDPDLVEPTHVVEDVEAAVDLMLQKEVADL
uniref:Haloacid dehalogenase-like hydrolase domain-containing 5 n=1 Tax=Sphaeramia orbicularis TaxID=375764 RepID=A0A672ZEE7_9TELE